MIKSLYCSVITLSQTIAVTGVRSTPLIEDRLIEIIRKEPELVALVGMGTVAVLLVLTAFILICFLDARRRELYPEPITPEQRACKFTGHLFTLVNPSIFNPPRPVRPRSDSELSDGMEVVLTLTRPQPSASCSASTSSQIQLHPVSCDPSTE